MAEWLSLAGVAARDGLPTRPIAKRQGEPLSRPRFIADVHSWRAALAAHPGERVLLYFDDSYDFACALFGAWHAGKVVCLPGDAQPATLQRLDGEVQIRAGDLPGALVPASSAPPVPLQPLDLQATRLIVYTSGSSGEPVAIPKRLAQLDAETRTLQAAFGAKLEAAGEVTVHATVSHQHIYGLLFHVLWPLAAGRPFETGRIAYPEQMAARLGAGPSVLVSSPAHLKRLPAALDWAAARDGVLAVFSSGGPLPPEAAESAQVLLGHSPIEVFGSSETGGIAWRQRAVDRDRWQAFAPVEWRLDDGLLSVRSPHLSHGEWEATADRAKTLPGGGFVLLGRADRIVKIEEKRVSLNALEQALTACEDVAEARLVLLAGPQLGAVVVPSAVGWARLRQQGKLAMNQRLREAMLQTVERVALPRRWRYVDLLPANALGKPTAALLAGLFGEAARPLWPEPAWQLREPERAEADIDVQPDLAAFDGHFPEAPILPGVVQLDWAVRFARECFPLPPRFLRAETLKFQRPVLPGAQLRLTLRWQPADRALHFSYRSANGMHASGKLMFEAEDV